MTCLESLNSKKVKNGVVNVHEVCVAALVNIQGSVSFSEDIIEL